MMYEFGCIDTFFLFVLFCLLMMMISAKRLAMVEKKELFYSLF